MDLPPATRGTKCLFALFPRSSSPNLLRMMDASLRDSSYVLSLLYDLMVLPLALQITSICGNVLARTLLGGRSERNEALLLHAFTERNFVVPDKTFGKKPAAHVSEFLPV